MKKIVIILLMVLFIPFVKAEGLIPEVESYVDGKPYWDDMPLTSTWAYEPISKKYINIDAEGNITIELDNINDDPTVGRGNINIKVDMPDNLKNKTIKIVLDGYPYKYTFVLDKSNNFTINERVVATNYVISSLTVDDGYDYPINNPQSVSVYDDNTTELALDYTSYYVKEEVKENEHSKKSMTILYIFGGAIALFILLFAALFIKAKNI